jgi:heterodisulfide reductase subunit C
MPQNVEFSKSFTTSLLEMVDGEHIKTCIQCGTCAGICPMAYWMDFPPRKMLATLRENIFDQVIDSKGIWMCVS